MSQSAHFQQEQEHQQQLLTMDSYRKWLYDNYTISNGDMLIELEESKISIYLAEHGLPADAELEE